MRLLLRNALFTLTVVLTLGLGIAVNSAVFSVLNVILFRPLPYRDARRIVALRQENPSRGLTQQLVSVPDYFDWERENQVFESIAAWNFLYFNLTGADQPERVEGLQVTAGFFPVLGVTAALGRTFLPEEEQPGRSRVACPTSRTDRFCTWWCALPLTPCDGRPPWRRWSYRSIKTSRCST